jgi:hypothetical protein
MDELPGRTNGADSSTPTGPNASRDVLSMATGGNNSVFFAEGSPNPIRWRRESFCCDLPVPTQSVSG